MERNTCHRQAPSLRGKSGRPDFKARGVLRTQGEKETPSSIKKSKLSWRGLTSGEHQSKRLSFWGKCQLCIYIVHRRLLRTTLQHPRLHGRWKDKGTAEYLGRKQKPLAGCKTLGNCVSVSFSAQQRTVPISYPAGVHLGDLSKGLRE